MVLSVIIPVYNAANYLRATVDSVLTQDFRDFEVILVNDGSTDASGELCDALKSKCEKIVVFRKENGGVSSARNAGIDIARGKYITFIDSDDAIAEGMFQDLIKECEEKNADKAFCGFEEITIRGQAIRHMPQLTAREVLNRDIIVRKMLYSGCTAYSYMNSVCGGIFKTELLRKHNLKFDNRPMGEDWLFNMQYCDIIKTAVFIDKPYYQYKRNETSATARYQPRQFELWLENRRYKRALSLKYDFKIDQKALDEEWVSKVLLYSMQTINACDKATQKVDGMLRHAEFIAALDNTEWINPKFLRPVASLLNKRLYRMAVFVLKLFALRIK